MPLRKKISKRFLKVDDAVPEPVPPAPSSPPILLPLQFGPSFSEPSSSFRPHQPMTRSQRNHRLSRSFSALDLPFRPFLNQTQSRDSDISNSSCFSDKSVDQPWRSQETWKALHTPSRGVPGLVHPSSLAGTSGWKSRNGDGFFAGRQTPRQKKKALDGPGGGVEDVVEPEWEKSRGNLLFKLQESQTYSPGSHPSMRDIGLSTPPSPRQPKTGSRPFLPMFADKGEVSLPTGSNTNHHQRNESLLPPLLPTTIQKGPSRSSSFTSLRPQRSLNFSNGPVTSLPPLDRPIPWGRRSSTDKQSQIKGEVTPHRPPKSTKRAPQKALPLPPNSESLCSPTPSFETSSMGCTDRSRDSSTTEEEEADSIVNHRERLITPVTPPRPTFRSSNDSLNARGMGTKIGKYGRSNVSASRQVSWDTMNSNSVGSHASGTHLSRGGWI